MKAFHPLRPTIPHLFFEGEEFDRYLDLLGRENLAVAVPLDPQSALSWKLDVEIIWPVPSEAIAICLSRSSLLVARPKDDVAQYAFYLAYINGALAYECEMEGEDGIVANDVTTPTGLVSRPSTANARQGRRMGQDERDRRLGRALAWHRPILLTGTEWMAEYARHPQQRRHKPSRAACAGQQERRSRSAANRR